MKLFVLPLFGSPILMWQNSLGTSAQFCTDTRKGTMFVSMWQSEVGWRSHISFGATWVDWIVTSWQSWFPEKVIIFIYFTYFWDGFVGTWNHLAVVWCADFFGDFVTPGVRPGLIVTICILLDHSCVTIGFIPCFAYNLRLCICIPRRDVTFSCDSPIKRTNKKSKWF